MPSIHTEIVSYYCSHCQTELPLSSHGRHVRAVQVTPVLDTFTLFPDILPEWESVECPGPVFARGDNGMLYDQKHIQR